MVLQQTTKGEANQSAIFGKFLSASLLVRRQRSAPQPEHWQHQPAQLQHSPHFWWKLFRQRCHLFCSSGQGDQHRVHQLVFAHSEFPGALFQKGRCAQHSTIKYLLIRFIRDNFKKKLYDDQFIHPLDSLNINQYYIMLNFFIFSHACL